MKKLLALLVLPVFLTPLTIISTEREIELAPSEQLSFFATPAYFEVLPKNPHLYHDTVSYKDKELTLLAEPLLETEPLLIDKLIVNQQLIPVFQLKNGYFIEASQLLVFDDLVLSKETIHQPIWLKKDMVVYDKPYVSGAKVVQTDLKPLQEVTAVEQALTYSGTYYRIDGKGWVSVEDIYTDQIDVVQALLLDKYNKPNLSVYVQRLDDGATAEVNTEKSMYAASVTKLATIYQVQKELNEGTIKLSDSFKYTKEVNSFRGFYDPEGTGSISKTPDDKDYTVEELLQALTKNSDNVASNMLGYYVADKLSRTFQTDIWLLAGGQWDMVDRQISAKTAGHLMAALYEQNGLVLDYMKETSFDATRISKDISVPVAHKTGDADEFRHDVAIVYADRPFVLSIFTENATYDDITAIANDVYNLLK